jgi:hypothetical protein
MVLILQSKKRTSKMEQKRVQEIKTELNKVLGVEKENRKKDVLERLKLANLFVLITDFKNIDLQNTFVSSKEINTRNSMVNTDNSFVISEIYQKRNIELKFKTIDPETFNFSSLTIEQLKSKFEKTRNL